MARAATKMVQTPQVHKAPPASTRVPTCNCFFTHVGRVASELWLLQLTQLPGLLPKPRLHRGFRPCPSVYLGGSAPGSLHYTPERCLVDGGFPLFWCGQKVSFKEPCSKVGCSKCLFWRLGTGGRGVQGHRRKLIEVRYPFWGVDLKGNRKETNHSF